LLASIKDVSSQVAKQLVAQYATIDDKGIHVLGGYPGILYPPYYWWQAGAMFGTLLDYWHYTGDDQYNDMVREGLIHQFGEHLDLVGICALSLQHLSLTLTDALEPVQERRKR
jgi:3-methylcrotonyl-CoA carboxylase beta subunit